uniref:Uncharacterized protein n=1 Tax=Helianthus annuus TaxID=4232 RepID=A0A251S1T0_HELAN
MNSLFFYRLEGSMVFTMRLSVRHRNSLHVVEIKNLQFLSTLQSPPPPPPPKKKIIPGMFLNKKIHCGSLIA